MAMRVVVQVGFPVLSENLVRFLPLTECHVD